MEERPGNAESDKKSCFIGGACQASGRDMELVPSSAQPRLVSPGPGVGRSLVDRNRRQRLR